jgi:uncharacterized membrane protein (DUF4010 family)
MTLPSDWWHLAVALALGLLVGLERERDGQGAAGSRTFGIAGLVGGVAAAISPYAVAGVLLATGVVAAAGVRHSTEQDQGSTTEVALVGVVALGALSWSSPSLAVGATVAVVILLWAKTPIHRFARDLVSEEDVRDALTFFVAAFVVLPLLPDADLGPYGVLNPRRIWLIVVLLTATGWVGYVASRVLGARRGLAITGLAGGFVSASATTGAMARRARDPAVRREALGAAVLASVSTLVLLVFICAYVSTDVLRALAPSLAAGLVALLVTAGVLLLRGGGNAQPVGRTPADEKPSAETHSPETPSPETPSPKAPSTKDVTGGASDEKPARPFALGPAALLALVLTVALFVGRWGAATFGGAGAVAVSGIAGLADAHAGALAAAQLAADGLIPVSTASLAVAAALASNTVLKLVLAFAAGGLQVGLRYSALMVLPVVAFAVPLALTR